MESISMKRVCWTSLLRLLLTPWIPTVAIAADDVIVVQDVIVEFARQVDVPARQSGAIAQMSCVLNGVVEAGDVVGSLDDSALMIQRRAAILRLDSARMAAEDEIELQYAETVLEEAQAELDDSEQTQQSVRGSIARNQLRRMRLAVQRGQLDVAQAKKRIRQAEIDRDLAAAELAVIGQQMDELRSVSPIDGVVLSLHHNVGEWVNAGDTVATIATADQLHCHALVGADQLDPATAVGLPVVVTWPAPTGHATMTGSQPMASLRGRVVSVDPDRLPGNRFRLHAEITNQRRTTSPSPLALPTAWQLVPGVRVTMRIERRAPQAANTHSSAGMSSGLVR